MESMGSHRGGLLTAGGVLSIVAGISQVICGGVLTVDFLVSHPHCFKLIDALLLPFLPRAWKAYILSGFSALCNYVGVPIWWVITGGCIGALGVVAVVGGIAALRGKSFGLSLAGAICALPSVILGILGIVFVSMSKREFGTGGEQSGI